MRRGSYILNRGFFMLIVDKISFQYQANKPVLNKVSFTLKAGEHLCVMGESGSGKSTLLKAIYGLIDLDNGSISWKNEEVLGPSHHLVPGMPFFKYVPQDFDLMPYTSVEENIQTHLSRFYLDEAKERTYELLEVIELTAFAKEKVKNLSGGQKQRVAIARALAKIPELILLDEPFSQIDNFKKNSLRRKLFSYLKDKNISCIVATHDAEEALAFADHMVVIKDQHLIANDTPKNLYQKKPNLYVASLFDDVNVLDLHGEKNYLYPHEIRIVDASMYRAAVRRSYFKNNYWLIEAVFKEAVIYVNHSSQLSSKDIIYLDFPSLKNK